MTEARRVNYGIYGNHDPALHAHVFARYAWEPEKVVHLLRTSRRSPRSAQRYREGWSTRPYPFVDAFIEVRHVRLRAPAA